MSTRRQRASAVLLADGRVLVIGAYNAFNNVALSTSGIYNPSSGQFGNVATKPGGARQNATASRALVSGGVFAVV